MRRRTPSQRLADTLLGRSLDDWVAEQRSKDASWDDVSRALTTATDGAVSLNPETLRRWYRDAPVARAPAA